SRKTQPPVPTPPQVQQSSAAPPASRTISIVFFLGGFFASESSRSSSPRLRFFAMGAPLRRRAGIGIPTRSASEGCYRPSQRFGLVDIHCRSPNLEGGGRGRLEMDR